MKYLKYFENKNELKNFVILKDSLNMFYIFKVLDYNKVTDVYVLRRLYQYFSNVNKIEQILDGDYKTLNIRQIKNNLLYQSEDLQDCVDKLPTLKNINKYNL